MKFVFESKRSHFISGSPEMVLSCLHILFRNWEPSENIYCWTFEDMLCAHGFLGISWFGRQFMAKFWWKMVVGVEWGQIARTYRKTHNISSSSSWYSSCLLNNLERQPNRPTNQPILIFNTNGNHKYNFTWLSENLVSRKCFTIICRKFNSFSLFFIWLSSL